MRLRGNLAMTVLVGAVGVSVAALFFDPSAHGSEHNGVLEDILNRGEVVCGVNIDLPGFTVATQMTRLTMKCSTTSCRQTIRSRY